MYQLQLQKYQQSHCIHYMPFEIKQLLLVFVLLAQIQSLCTSSSGCTPTHRCNSYGFCVIKTQNVTSAIGLSTGSIAGIIIGWIVVLIAIYLGGLWLIFYRYRKGKYNASQSDSSKDASRKSSDAIPREDTAGMAVEMSNPDYPKQQYAPSESIEGGSKFKTRNRKMIPDDI